MLDELFYCDGLNLIYIRNVIFDGSSTICWF